MFVGALFGMKFSIFFFFKNHISWADDRENEDKEVRIAFYKLQYTHYQIKHTWESAFFSMAVPLRRGRGKGVVIKEKKITF